MREIDLDIESCVSFFGAKRHDYCPDKMRLTIVIITGIGRQEKSAGIAPGALGVGYFVFLLVPRKSGQFVQPASL